MRLQIHWRRPRRAQRLPELNNYPETPQAYYEGEFPGSKIVETLRTNFNVKLQKLPEHNVYPLTHYYPASNLETSNKVSFKTKLQRLPQLDLHPETNQHSAYVLQEANRVEFKVNHLTALEAFDAPKNFGEYPGSALATSFRANFKVKRQTLSELNIYPLIQVAEDIVAWETHFEKTKQTKFKRQNVELNTYPVTPTGYYSGYYPGSKSVETLKANFNARIQPLPQLDSFPAAPVVVDVDAFKLWPTYRISFKVKIQNVIGVERFPAPIPSVVFAFGVPSRIDPDGQGVEGLF